ncbi:MAG: hypothetical protein R3A13_03070 [Bdellovibrionota bacterium]
MEVYLKKQDQHYVHELQEVWGEGQDGFDGFEIFAGNVSITPLDIFSFGKLEEESVTSLQKIWNAKIL